VRIDGDKTTGGEMIIYLLNKMFGALIGKLPEDQKEELWGKFTALLTEAIKAAAAGAVQGATKK